LIRTEQEAGANLEKAPIREHYRLEFEKAGVEEVRKRTLQSLYSDEKLRHAIAGLDDKNDRAARSAKNMDLAIAMVTMAAAIAAVVTVFNSLGWKPF
jgi:hypothetical protein